ncbi:zinc finger protein basonuclin-2-like isoform X3 [Daktulosphaira vitifoliae]|uniref:zinc finger protein basonuclin-2-like isoform X3 n=1 Tax=Daktulosphaira vitifoliae TaxID=58002 RepID=UPI0021A9E104|nr:zinc finger protein basonuclin-2-like isoform X3 [Daktulosphaira vitifoliae]
MPKNDPRKKIRNGNGRVIGAPLRMRRPEDQSPSAASAGLMMEVWASVASWFLRPEMAGASVPPIVPQPPPMPIRPSRSSSDPPQMAMPPTICTAIRCTVPGCMCDCFTPGKLHIRFCDACGHGWVPHALDKLGFGGASLGNGAVEPIQPNVAFDIASLVLYGCQALPIRLKILLDRLFSVLRQDEVSAVLRGFGWTHEDYARGYILQEPHGGILERWNICSPEEEPLVLQQFLRFGETRMVTQQLLLHGLNADFRALPSLETDMKRLMERQKQQQNHDHKPNFETKFRPRSPSSLMQPRLPSTLGNSPPSPPKPTFGFAKPSSGSSSSLALPASPLVNTNGGSPPTTSPTSVSPLNKLQNMQPFDFRKMQSTGGFPGKPSSERRNSDLLPPPPRPNQNEYNNSKYTTPESLAGSSEFGSEDGDEEEENSQSALNLSKDNNSKTARPHRGHMRKTSMPLKRQWGSASLPLNLGTQLINPATGKKRVQCNVCLKTFCDKGALKIHFSAVHLREMHKCTVEGCNMMFSSRRSRNRHSANPNPKLHSPHLRRKISPHDGRSSQAHHPMVISPLQASAMNQLAFGAFPLLTGSGPDLHAAGSKQSSSSGLHLADELRRSADFSSDNMDEYMDDEEDGIVVDGATVDDDDDSEHRSDRSKRMSEESEDDGASTIEPPNNNNKPPIVPTNVRKRKNQNPTRFAAAADLSDEGMSCTDEGSAPSPKNNNNEEEVTAKQNQGEDQCLNLSRKRSASPIDGRLHSADSRDSLLSENDDGEDDECNSDSDGHVYGMFENGRFVEMEEVPVDKENPRKCVACGKTFPNHFSVKTHYQNVHLKLMHKCVVDGCNAAFPSKRSRDRHSSNLNLHRKLLSTSPTAADEQLSHRQQQSQQPPVSAAAAVAAAAAAAAAASENPYGMHAEFLARLYADSQQFQAFSNGGMILPQFGPFRHHPPAMTNGGGVPRLVYSADEDLPPSPDKETGMYSCRFCSKAFPDKNGMREHYEQLHMHEMHRCKVQGCGMVFSSRTKRNAHAENHPPVSAS